MKRLLITALLLALGLASSVPAPASTVAKTGSLVIRHQLKGCHVWSYNQGPARASLDIRLARGGMLTIENVDPMVHQLMQRAGPAVAMRTVSHAHMTMVGLHKINGPGVMNHMGAALKLTFRQAGVYRFTTEDLGDYFELETMGKVNDLKLTVRVS